MIFRQSSSGRFAKSPLRTIFPTLPTPTMPSASPATVFLLAAVSSLLFQPQESGAEARQLRYRPEDDPCHPQAPPCFPPKHQAEMTRFVGDYAEIKCLVYGAASDQAIVFRRTSSMVPIALGRDVFLENDNKYSIVHDNGSALWTLVVDFLTEEDSGQYECNVHQRIIYFKLQVKKLPPPTRYPSYDHGKNMYITVPNFVKEGDAFKVSCFCKVGFGQDALYLDWYRRGEQVSTSSDRGIKIAKGWYNVHGGEQRVTMEFSQATPDLSDTYECRFIRGKMISDAIKAEIRVRQRRRDYLRSRLEGPVMPPPERVVQTVFTPTPNENYNRPRNGGYKHVTQNDSPAGRNGRRRGNPNAGVSLGISRLLIVQSLVSASTIATFLASI